MLFSEIYYLSTDSGLYQEVITKYGQQIAEWFYHRFGKYELLYDVGSFTDQFLALLIENHIELLKIKRMMQINDMWEFGNIVDSTTDMTSTSTSNGTQSYQGYNVEGDFSKNSADGNTTGNTKAKSTSINHTDEFNKLIAFDYSTLLNKIYDKFVELFVLCYN